ncbi:MAG: prepilin-type N-terminal cleavage/methylation domain-containing protein [Candidatus Omnitrophota bacterium]
MYTHQRPLGIRAFTLIEILVVLVIIGILSAIAIPSYQNFIEDGRAQVCETNLLALKSAFDIYMVEHNVVPGDLGQIPAEDIEKALACARSGERWKEKFVRFLDDQKERAYAYASLIDELGKGNLRMLLCPSDTRRLEPGASRMIVSYGINTNIASISKEDYEVLPVETVVIGDSEDESFTSVDSLTKRHKHMSKFVTNKYGNVVTLGGWVEPFPLSSGQQSNEWLQARDRVTKKCGDKKRFSNNCKSALEDLKRQRRMLK